MTARWTAAVLLAACGGSFSDRAQDGDGDGNDGGDGGAHLGGRDGGDGDGGGGDAAAPACVPAIELCGDRIDQDCDGRDGSCGDHDGDRYPACRAGDDLATCDCDDTRIEVYPGLSEQCDGRDNDCDGRVDETATCCAGCAGLDDPARADGCLPDGACDCSAAPGTGPCPAGTACCSTGCVDLRTDAAHCGFCERPCAPGGDTCADGVCGCGDGPACDFVHECAAGRCG